MIKVTITKMDGEVLDTLYIDTDYLKNAAVYPDNMGAQCVVEVLEENFETKEKP